MDHTITAEGVGFRLRPLRVEDAPFIVELRTDAVLSRYLHKTSPRVEDQVEWTRKYLERQGDWYFVVEDLQGKPQGAISIYNFDTNANEAEWGRWILRKGSLAAVESAALIYDVGFMKLGLTCMYTHTEQENEPVVSFHRSIGSTEHGLVVGPEGERWFEQRMRAEDWPEKRQSFEAKIVATARLASR